jgi:hypothetical protein
MNDSEHTFSISRTYDETFVSMLMEKLFDKITVDEFPSMPETNGMLCGDAVLALEVRYGSDRVGAFLFIGDEVHTLLLEPIRGRLAVKAARAAAEWVWANTDKPCINSFYYNHRPDVAWYCRAVGLKPVGTETTQYHFNGNPVIKTKVRLERP